MQLDHMVCLLRQIRIRDISNCSSQHTLMARFGQHANNIGAFATLADAEHQRIFQARWLLVNGIEAGRGQRHRQAIDGAQQIVGITTGVVACPPRRNHHIFDLPALNISR